jgi:predicted nucleic acid-binding protein
VIVPDTSAVLESLAGVDTGPRLLDRLAAARALHAPHLIDVGFLAALRGLVLGSKVSEDRAHDARRDFAALRVIRYPIIGLADRVWALRHRMTPYDGCFVTLAEALRCPLVTCDGRMARSRGHDAQIELFEART